MGEIVRYNKGQLVQKPSQLALTGIAGNPLNLNLSFTLLNEDSVQIPWSDVSNWSVLVTDNHSNEVEDNEPTITNPEDGVLTLSWTPPQTSRIGSVSSQSFWAISMTISSTGPLTLLAGTLTMRQKTGI